MDYPAIIRIFIELDVSTIDDFILFKRFVLLSIKTWLAYCVNENIKLLLLTS